MKYREAVKNGKNKSPKTLETVVHGDESMDDKEDDNSQRAIESCSLKELNEIDYSNVNFYDEDSKDNSVAGRFSNRFEMYFVVNSALISTHPSNPTYDYTLCSTKMEPEPNETLYCISKEYGVFYTNSKKMQFIIQV